MYVGHSGTHFADRYTIVSPIGRGGMGTVYRARDVVLGREVALKILNARIDHELANRFEREAQAIARLDHPSCVRILDYGRTRYGFHFIAMELLAGVTLAVRLRDGPLSPARTVHITSRMLDGLSHAHGQGVLHRDIKPENVVLVARGIPRVVLIDFGLAWLRDEPGTTGRGMCIGSPSYIAPERLLGSRSDPASDLYSVGVVMFEMLAGVRPFAGPSPVHTMQLALHRPPRSLRAFCDDIPAALEAVVMRALAKDPMRRFRDAEEMRSALAEVPAEEVRAAQIETDLRDEAAATLSIIDLARPSWWRRLWSRLWYGRWRWRAG
jgi:serine/threonine-protein kinase